MVNNPDDSTLNNDTTANEHEAKHQEALPYEEHPGIGEHKAEAAPVEKLQSELNEAKDKYLRLFADFENYRRRVAKEKLEFLVTANEGLIISLLPVLDDFERAQKSLAATGPEAEAMRQGLELIHTKFVKVLEAKGLKAMQAQGEAFNPELHEAITQFAAPTSDMKGKVIDEVEKGYYLGEKVIRYAKVVVGA